MLCWKRKRLEFFTQIDSTSEELTLLQNLIILRNFSSTFLRYGKFETMEPDSLRQSFISSKVRLLQFDFT